jgi:hypothetical protein
MRIRIRKNLKTKKLNNKYENKPVSLEITNYLLNRIKNEEIQKLTKKNYEKYKSIPLGC